MIEKLVKTKGSTCLRAEISFGSEGDCGGWIDGFTHARTHAHRGLPNKETTIQNLVHL